MKQKALRLLALSMALNILFSSMGLAFYEHSCSMSSTKTTSFHEKEACCKLKEIKEEINTDHSLKFKQEKCCETHSVHKKLDSRNNYSSKKQHLHAVGESNKKVIFSFLSLPSLAVDYPILYTNPPPISGRQHLICFQQYRI